MNTLGSFSSPRRLVLRGTSSMEVPATDIFLSPPSGPLLTCDLPCRFFRERPMTLISGLCVQPISRMRFTKCAFLDGYRRFLCTSRCSRIRSWSHWKNGQPKTVLLPTPSSTLSPQHFRCVSLWRCYSVKTSRTLHALWTCRFSSLCPS